MLAMEGQSAQLFSKQMEIPHNDESWKKFRKKKFQSINQNSKFFHGKKKYCQEIVLFVDDNDWASFIKQIIVRIECCRI